MNLISNKRSVGLDIADHTIEVVEIKNSKISSLNSISLEAGIVERGMIKDQEKLGKAIKGLFDKATPKAISGNRVVFGLPESQTYIYIFELEPHSKKERGDLILQELISSIPIDQENLIYSHKVLQEDKKGAKILTVSADKEVLVEWLRFFKKMKINIDFFDIEGFAVFRSLFDRETKEPVCVVDIGSESTRISIFDEKGLYHSFSISIAGNSFTNKIAKVLEKNFAEAELEKIKLGLIGKNKKINSALSGEIDQILAEISEVLEYYKNETKKEVKELILLGGSAQLKGLVKYISNKLGISTRLAESKFLEKSKGLKYIEAIGLAMKVLNKKWLKNDLVIPIKDIKLKKKKKKVEIQKIENVTEEGDLEIEEGGRSVRKQLILLLIILIIGAGLIGLAFWYKSIKEGKKKAQENIYTEISEVVEILEENIISTSTEENLEIMATSTPTSTDNIIEQVTSTQDFVVVKDTEVGYLNVREGPGVSYVLIETILPSEIFELLEEDGDWTKIQLSDDEEGWVSSKYLDKIE